MFELQNSTAIGLTILCSFMWGSWFQTVKRLKGYPLSAYMLWIYSFSFIVVWASIWLLSDKALSAPIGEQIAANPNRVSIAFVCGAMAAIGMQNKMWVVRKLGMILASSISSTFSILLGTMYSILLGGIAECTNLTLVIFATLVLLGATLVCQCSSHMRDRDLVGGDHKKAAQMEKGETKVVILAIMNIAFLASAYPVGLSIVTRTVSNPNGVDALVGIGAMCAGAFIGTAIYSGIKLVKAHQVDLFFHPSKEILFMAFLSSIGHYGGNVINALVSPQLSVAISWPMSNSFSMWSYSWGLVYGEYKGAYKKTYVVLFLGIVLSIVGLLLFSVATH